MEDSPIYARACWCRTCDHAGKPGLSLGAALRIGPEFIVCPDCGNKRCPKGTNHELACTNSNELGQKGSEWEHALGFTALTTEQVEAGRRSAYAYAFGGPEAPTPALLRPLNAGEHQAQAALLARAEKAEARVKELQAELADQEVDMLRLIQENATRII